MLGMRKHTCIHAGALCTLYAQSKACTGGLYADHPGCCSVAQVGSRCLSLSCLTTVRRCPQICSNASCFALCTDLRGIRSIGFLLAVALLALSPLPGAEVEAQPRSPEKCNPRLRWKTALTIALLRGECLEEGTWAGRTVACTYAVSLAAPSARCAPVLRGSQNSSLRPPLFFYFFIFYFII